MADLKAKNDKQEEKIQELTFVQEELEKQLVELEQAKEKSDAELNHCRDELEKTSENLNKKKKGVAARAAAFNGGGELQNLKVELTKLSAENRRLAKKWRGMEAKYIEVETSAEEIINELTNEAEEAKAALGDAFAPSRIKLPHSTFPLFSSFCTQLSCSQS